MHKIIVLSGSISLIVISYLLSALFYLIVDRVQEKHPVLALILNGIRNFINIIFEFVNCFVSLDFYYNWIKLTINVFEYLILNQSVVINSITKTAIQFVVIGIIKLVLKIFDVIGKKHKAFDCFHEYEPKLKEGKHK